MREFDPKHGGQPDEAYRQLYIEPEQADGYTRDACVFEDADIYDNLSVSAKYSGGALLTYSLNAFNPFEGLSVAITGDKGRIEMRQLHGYYNVEQSDTETVSVHFHDGSKARYTFPSDDKGASDRAFLDGLFRREEQRDPLGRMAGAREGAMSLLVGAAGNESIRTGLPIEIGSLIDLSQYIEE